MKKKVLFVANHLTVGGVQKSLISALESIKWSGSPTSIGDGAFDGCENLVLKVKAESTAEEYVLQNDLLYELK